MHEQDGIELNNGRTMPLISVGHYRRGRSVDAETIMAAFGLGVRGADTAQGYLEHEPMRQAICRTSIPRDQLFVTTKISPPRDGKLPSDIDWNDYIRSHLDNDLELERIDLLLIHTPNIADVAGRKRLWRTMERFVDDGRVRSIGVSNYGINQLTDLLSCARIKPAVNQIEIHPWCQQPELRDFCAQHGILVQAFGVLDLGNGISDPCIKSIAAKHLATPAQVLVRWQTQSRRPVVIRSSSKAHLQELLDISFDLDECDLTRIDQLDQGLERAQCRRPGELE